MKFDTNDLKENLKDYQKKVTDQFKDFAENDWPDIKDYLTEIDEKYMKINVDDYNCMAVVTSFTYNSDGIMFEFTQSRHRPDYFRFQDNAVRRASGHAPYSPPGSPGISHA